MKVGFDAKKAIHNQTGIGNYSRRCINAVRDAKIDIKLFYGQKPILGELWRNIMQWLSVRHSHIDIYHGLSNELPFGIGWSKVKTVVTIHDLIFLRMPETYGWLQRHILKIKTRYACRIADRIIAASEMTKRDIIYYYGINPSRIEVIYQSISDIYRTPMADYKLKKIAHQYKLPECYILCVGTIQQRKNQHTLVKALPLLPSNIHLVLVGKEEAYAKQVRQTAGELKVTSRLHIYHKVPTEHLPAFYQQAFAFVFLSCFEGFGIPIAEALAMGIPVIAAIGSCLEEAGGPDSIYIMHDDYQGLANAIMQLQTDNKKREDMKQRGRDYSLRFTDKRLASSLLSLYKSVLSTAEKTNNHKEFLLKNINPQPHKFLFYIRNFSFYLLPNTIIKWWTQKRLQSFPDSKLNVLKKRRDYYCRLAKCIQLPDSVSTIANYRYPWRSKHKYTTYFFDLYNVLRCFPSGLRFLWLFGDVNYELHQPTFVKSRPIIDAQASSMNVIMKLNQIRHFHFIKSDIPFTQKKDMLVSRTTWAKNSPQRTLLNKMFIHHPMCNVGKTKSEENEDFPESVREHLTIQQQLQYKFIACIEGNDVATNLKWVMSSNSIAVMPRPHFETWFMEGTLVPDYHYIEVKPDYSNLIEKIEYYCKHTEEAQAIIEHAHQHVSQFLDKTSEWVLQILVAKKYFEMTNLQ